MQIKGTGIVVHRTYLQETNQEVILTRRYFLKVDKVPRDKSARPYTCQGHIYTCRIIDLLRRHTSKRTHVPSVHEMHRITHYRTHMLENRLAKRTRLKGPELPRGRPGAQGLGLANHANHSGCYMARDCASAGNLATSWANHSNG